LLLLFVFCGTGVWIQGLHLKPLHQPFFMVGFFFEIGSQELFPQGWLWITILLISASWVDKITGVNHWHPAHLGICINYFSIWGQLVLFQRSVRSYLISSLMYMTQSFLMASGCILPLFSNSHNYSFRKIIFYLKTVTFHSVNSSIFLDFISIPVFNSYNLTNQFYLFWIKFDFIIFSLKCMHPEWVLFQLFFLPTLFIHILVNFFSFFWQWVTELDLTACQYCFNLETRRKICLVFSYVNTPHFIFSIIWCLVWFSWNLIRDKLWNSLGFTPAFTVLYLYGYLLKYLLVEKNACIINAVYAHFPIIL
jgi:hypothetical protein